MITAGWPLRGGRGKKKKYQNTKKIIRKKKIFAFVGGGGGCGESCIKDCLDWTEQPCSSISGLNEFLALGDAKFQTWIINMA